MRTIWTQNYSCKTNLEELVIAHPEGKPWFMVVIPTIHRPGNTSYLLDTIGSLLEQWPTKEENPWFSKLKILVVSGHQMNDPKHDEFEAAKTLYAKSQYLSFDSIQSIDWQQLHLPKGELENATKTGLDNYRINLAASLYLANKMEPEWVLIQDDSSPLCSQKWREILHVMCEVFKQQPHRCGFYVGMNSTGFIVPRKILRKLADIILDSTDAMDLQASMETCIRGTSYYCTECLGEKRGMAVSSTSLFYRLSEFSLLGAKEYLASPSCGWRQSMNGYPDIFVVNS